MSSTSINSNINNTMSNLSIKSEKSDPGQQGMVTVGSSGSNNNINNINNNKQSTYDLGLQFNSSSSHKQRLHELFALIDKEYDALYEENQELRAKLAALTGGSQAHVIQPNPLQKQTSMEAIGIAHKPQQSGASLAKSLRFVKLQKNKLQKQKIERKYLMLKDFKEHRDGIWEVSACPWDVGYFATASADHTARVCSADGSRASVVYLAHMGSVNSIRFHPLEKIVCTASGDKTCHIWRLPQQNQMKPTVSSSIQNKQGGATNAAGISAIDLGSTKPKPKMWTPILGDRPGDVSEPTTPGTSPPLSHAFLHESGSRPSSSQLLPNSSNPISIPSITPERGQSLEASPTTDHEHEEAAKFAESVGNIVVRNPLLELKGHNGPVVAAAWTASHTSVATASWDHQVRVWSVDNGRSVATLASNHEKSHKITNVTTHATSPIVLFSVTDGSFRIWDYRNTPDKPDVVSAHQGAASTAIFASDGNSILSAGDDRIIKIWDLRSYKTPKATIRCHSGVNRLAVSPVSHSIVIPTDGKRSSIYDLQGGRVGKFYHYEKTGHKSMVTSAAWSTDESVIFTSGFDRRVVAWGESP